MLAQRRIFATVPNQLLVRAALNDAPVIEHENLIGTHNRRKPMRDDHRRSVRHQMFQRFLNQTLGRGVYTCGRFIENQNRRILQQSARDREPLLFPDTQLHTALAHYTLQFVWESFDKLARIGGFHCAP